MDRPTFIFGHRNPDADAICSALAYAEYKRRTATGEFVAARCGNSNVRIDAILDRFGVGLPRFMGDVTPRIRDRMTRNPVTVAPDATAAEALDLIDRHDIQLVPVVDAEHHLLGGVSIHQLGQSFLPKAGPARDVRRVNTSLSAIARVLEARAMNLVDPDEVGPLYVRVAAMDVASFDGLQDREGIPPEQTVIVVGDRRDIQERSIERGVRLVVISGSRPVAPEVVAMARAAGVSMIGCAHDSASTAWAIRSAARVEAIMTPVTDTFAAEETLRNVRRRTATLGPAVFMVTGDEGELVGVFSRRDIQRPGEMRLILVDHNELSQAVPGAEEAEIVEVVDHHRLGDLRTQEPILFLNRPVGSTCTIVADLFRRDGLEVSPALAGVLMGGLVSDTLNLRSPTTTDVDVMILGWLEERAGLTGAELAEIIFSSGSVVAAQPAPEVIGLDRKLYEEGGVRFAVSQVEELGFAEFWKQAEPLGQALNASREEDGLDFSALLVTDVKSQDSLLLVSGDEALLARIPYPAVEEEWIFQLDGIVSRKKQLLPFLTGILRAARE